MTDEEFAELKIKIRIASHRLTQLQKIHRSVTGQNYHTGGHLSLPKEYNEEHEKIADLMLDLLGEGYTLTDAAEIIDRRVLIG